MLSKMVLGSLAIQAGLASPLSRPLTCAPVSGNKTIDAYQLYPENVDFDTRRCIVYSRFVTPKLIAMRSILYIAPAVSS
jgi:hypothetical protein